jgi:hypothetical protein
VSVNLVTRDSLAMVQKNHTVHVIILLGG